VGDCKKGGNCHYPRRNVLRHYPLYLPWEGWKKTFLTVSHPQITYPSPQILSLTDLSHGRVRTPSLKRLPVTRWYRRIPSTRHMVLKREAGRTPGKEKGRGKKPASREMFFFTKGRACKKVLARGRDHAAAGGGWKKRRDSTRAQKLFLWSFSFAKNPGRETPERRSLVGSFSPREE